VWATFVEAVENRNSAATRALFGCGEIDGAYAWDDFRLAADSREQTPCLRYLGAEQTDGVSITMARSIEDLKDFQEPGLDLKRAGHLMLPLVQQSSYVLWRADKETAETLRRNQMLWTIYWHRAAISIGATVNGCITVANFLARCSTSPRTSSTRSLR
jgi:hypothetical protein